MIKRLLEKVIFKAIQHHHDWLILYTCEWRDQYGKPFVVDFYKCDRCGTTSHIKTPKSVFRKGLRSMELRVNG